jgi:hypothetical protein
MLFKELTQLFIVGPALAAAALTYGIFAFLDKKASETAKNTITEWIRGEGYRDVELRQSVVNAFDHLYGTNLISLKAFFRSSLLSMLVFYIFMFTYIGPMNVHELVFISEATLPITILSDYLSLFIIKQCLRMATSNALVAVLLSFVAAAIAVGFMLFVSRYTIAFIVDMYFWVISGTFPSSTVSLPTFLIFPTLFVHGWLPLFLLGGQMNHGLVTFFRATAFAQWFVKHGNSHPIEAIGITASVLVFVISVVWQIMPQLDP